MKKIFYLNMKLFYYLIFLICFIPKFLFTNDLPNTLHNPIKNLTIFEEKDDKKIAALMLDVFLPGWRECIDWKKGSPTIQCVPFPNERPEKCSKEIWNKAMIDIKKGTLKKC
ncbi:hypothetical protein Mgra_00007173 [Meloidogyne graminicola]|uniref:Uncharacterized protein n=1 Tax=Meloidogyne graminicola TaxID=189291 RepID=A0A8S9ZJX0_9BILA|nr:hypothetical protein Mgra_00007173 [Meloidogyne graminicola]